MDDGEGTVVLLFFCDDTGWRRQGLSCWRSGGVLMGDMMIICICMMCLKLLPTQACLPATGPWWLALVL